MTYAPSPGSAAFRGLAYLQSLPAGTELSTAAWAEALGVPLNNMGPLMLPLHTHGLVRRRQKWEGARSPWFWSLPTMQKTMQKTMQNSVFDVPVFVPPVIPAGSGSPDADDVVGLPDEDGGADHPRDALHRGDRSHVAHITDSETLRCALWNDGELVIWCRGECVRYSAGEVEQLVAYLDRVLLTREGRR